jgi:hypothetical protein
MQVRNPKNKYMIESLKTDTWIESVKTYSWLELAA